MCVVPILYCLPGVAWPGVGSSRGRGKGATGRQAGSGNFRARSMKDANL